MLVLMLAQGRHRCGARYHNITGLRKSARRRGVLSASWCGVCVRVCVFSAQLADLFCKRIPLCTHVSCVLSGPNQDPSGPSLSTACGTCSRGNGKGSGRMEPFHVSRPPAVDRAESPVVAGGDTGSVSKTESGIIALCRWDSAHPSAPGANQRRQRKLSLDVEWSAPVTAAKPTSLGVGMRDPARALKMADGNWYVGAGSGFGGTGPQQQEWPPKQRNGCLAWFKATNSTLRSSVQGCLLENHTTGHRSSHRRVESD